MNSFNRLLVLGSYFSLILAQSNSGTSAWDQACVARTGCSDFGSTIKAHCLNSGNNIGLTNNDPTAQMNADEAGIKAFADCICGVPEIVKTFDVCVNCIDHSTSLYTTFAKLGADCKALGTLSASPSGSGTGGSGSAASASPSASPSGSGTGGSGSGASASPSASPSGSGTGGSESGASASPSASPTHSGNGTGAGASPSGTGSGGKGSGAGLVTCSLALLGGIVIGGSMLLV